jgi:hypothetical protein
MKKIHCSKGGTNGTKNYSRQSYYETAEVIYGDGIKQYRMAVRVHHRTGATTSVEEGESPGHERVDGRNSKKQRAI